MAVPCITPLTVYAILPLISFVFKRESFANHSINFGGELTTNNLREVFLFELTLVFYVLFASLGFFT